MAHRLPALVAPPNQSLKLPGRQAALARDQLGPQIVIERGPRVQGAGPQLKPIALGATRATLWRTHTFVLVRAATYATLFIGLLLVFVPSWILARSGIIRPARLGPVELAGTIVGVAGGAIAVWCILTFALVGKGTPAPFDPPRRLVVQGPYRHVRNPMYIGAALALCGAAIFYRSISLSGYVALFLLATHLFVVWYEEPALARLFGDEYRAYRARVRRWLPRTSTDALSGAT